MKLISNLLLLFAFSSSAKIPLKSLVEFVFEDYYCVFYEIDSKCIRWFIENIAEISKIPMYSIHFVEYSEAVCYGLLLCKGSEDTDAFAEDVHGILELHNQINRILIFTTEYSDDSAEKLRNVTGERDVHIYTFECLPQVGENSLYDVNGTSMSNVTFTLYRNGEEMFNVDATNKVVDGFFFKKTLWKPHMRRAFKISLFDCPPYVVYGENTGLEYNMMMYMTRNMEKEFFWYDKTSIQGKNVTLWDLMKRDVVERRSDMALCSQYLLSLEKMNLSFTIPYDAECLTFLVPKPRYKPERYFVFQPLELEIWALVVTTLVTISIFFCAYKSPEIKRSLSFHQLLSIWYFTTLICTAIYSAGISSTLTYPPKTRPIKTIKDLVDLPITIEGLNKTAKYLTNKSLYDVSYIFAYSTITRPETQNTNVAKFITAFSNTFVTKSITNFERENFRLLNECIGSFDLVFPLKKHSRFQKLFNKRIYRLLEHGFIVKWKKDALVGLYVKSSEDSGKLKRVPNTNISLVKLQGAFLTLFCGYCCSLLVFIFEIFKIGMKRRTKMNFKLTI